MSFKEIRKKAIHCLLSGYVEHELRNQIDTKNLLHTGEISIEEVIELLKRTNGTQHQASPHHWEPGIDVHVCKPVVSEVSWYIKFYFIKPNIIFISVHK